MSVSWPASLVADGSFREDLYFRLNGITIEILEAPALGPKRVLYRRQLDPAHRPADRGPQTIAIDQAAGT